MTQDITNLINDAKNGNPGAQYNLGVCYHSGRDGIEHRITNRPLYGIRKQQSRDMYALRFISVCCTRTEKV